MAEEPEFDPDYLKSLQGAEWFVILSRGAFGFRYGPYSAVQAGEILSRCANEGIPALITGNCGTEFDWELAKDFVRGNPAEWLPIDDAPRDGSLIMADVDGFETPTVWWNSWEWWREAFEGGEVGKPVTPRRWRKPTEDEVKAYG